MKMMKFALAATLLSSSLMANAALTTLVDVSAEAVNKGFFTNDYAFNLAGLATTTGSASSNYLTSTIRGKTSVVTDISTGFVNVFAKNDAAATHSLASFAFGAADTTFNLAAGDYFFRVTGNAVGKNGGSYNLFAEANVAPVPEPETYALMGMGLLGLLAARRRKQA